jgi:hypothetical protein
LGWVEVVYYGMHAAQHSDTPSAKPGTHLLVVRQHLVVALLPLAVLVVAAAQVAAPQPAAVGHRDLVRLELDVAGALLDWRVWVFGGGCLRVLQ